MEVELYWVSMTNSTMEAGLDSTGFQGPALLCRWGCIGFPGSVALWWSRKMPWVLRTICSAEVQGGCIIFFFFFFFGGGGGYQVFLLRLGGGGGGEGSRASTTGTVDVRGWGGGLH